MRPIVVSGNGKPTPMQKFPRELRLASPHVIVATHDLMSFTTFHSQVGTLKSSISSARVFI